MEADPVNLVEGNIDMLQLPGMKTPPGSKSMARSHEVPQEPGRSEHLPEELPEWGSRFTQTPGSCLYHSGVMGAKVGVMQGYRRTKEKEVRWDGCSEVGVAHSTDEVGEPT